MTIAFPNSSRRAGRSAAPAILTLALLASACGGGDDSNTGGTGGTGSTCTTGSAVTIAAGGASPVCLQVAPGAAVTITNDRTSAVEIRSAPHPTHGTCPELDATPVLLPTESTSVTMTTLGDCRFHDHGSGVALGVIRVATPGTPDEPYDPPGSPGY